jgi:tRNA 5-methylaminomethyl-2-thiouridine biosynthesis bifunctional protein
MRRWLQTPGGIARLHPFDLSRSVSRVNPITALIPAQFDVASDAVLHSPLYHDLYASADGAFAQAEHVFLTGNDLPLRWHAARTFVIVETGFGAAVNFLSTWEAWRRSAPAAARLHYVSVEKHPFLREDLARILSRWPHCAGLASELLEQYPPPLCGFHRLTLDAGRVILTLLLGDVVDVLPQLEARAHAFFLDGFAPSKNPQMWSDRVFGEIARLAAPDATAATYTVAAAVRDGLQRAGFSVRKAPGFGRKQDMLCARFEARGALTQARVAPPGNAIVIGAGLAGSACAAQLVSRGLDVELIERHAGPAREASGNPAGLMMPAFSLDWNLSTRLTVAAFLYALRRFAPSQDRAWFPTGVLQLARDTDHLTRHRHLIERYRLPPELIRTVNAQEGGALVGQRVAGPGWWLASAGWADPAQVCRGDLTGVRCWFDRYAARLRRTPNAQWEVLSEAGAVIARAPLVILANAHAAADLLGRDAFPLRVTRGQVSLVLQPAGAALRAPVCREGYITPAIDGLLCVGASYDLGSDEMSERLDDHRGNLQRLQRLLPGYVVDADPGQLTGRVALRTVAPDRMPVLGQCSGGEGAQGLFACLALASRGLTYAPLLAEALACMINGEPLPMERALLARLAPARFAVALQT